MDFRDMQFTSLYLSRWIIDSLLIGLSVEQEVHPGKEFYLVHLFYMVKIR